MGKDKRGVDTHVSVKSTRCYTFHQYVATGVIILHWSIYNNHSQKIKRLNWTHFIQTKIILSSQWLANISNLGQMMITLMSMITNIVQIITTLMSMITNIVQIITTLMSVITNIVQIIATLMSVITEHSTNNCNSDVSDNGTSCPEDTVSTVSEPLDTDDTDAIEYINLVDCMKDPLNPLKFLILAYV